MENTWQGKTIGFLGDSITEGIGCERGKRYWDELQTLLGCTSHSYGVNGAAFRDLAGQADRMHRELGEKIDAISVFAGTNDYNGARPIGSFYTEPVEEKVIVGYDGEEPRYGTRKHRDLIFDTATFCGSINFVLGHLRTLYPTKPIYFMYANRGGVFFDEYVETVKKAANVWACPLIDLNALCGLYPRNDTHAALFFANESTDRLHPSAGGHKRMAQAIAHALRAVSPYDHE